MKPYIGILIDSFWEAVSSKVLWALLLGSTFVLLALAPFGLTTERSFKFSSADVNSALKNQLLEKFAKGLDGKGSAGAKAISGRLDAKFKERVKKKVEDTKSNEDIRTRELVEELNRLLTDRQLYSEAAFPTTGKIDRFKEIIDKLPEQASDDEVEELNRRLLYTSFPSEINPTRGEQIFLSYAGFKITDAIPLTQKQIRQYFEPLVLMGVLKLGLAVIVIFVAIIVTSSIIPDTFKSGSLHLMLSKPISRTWLFLSKFFGGCIFVTLNLVYVILGLYLIAGLRFDIWNHGLLACIPLLLFVFVIFYCVSSLAGILWGNAIVCVVACMVFWGFCFAIGTVREVMHEPVERNQLISRITEIEGNLLTVTEPGKLQIWNAEHSIWQPATDVRSNFGGRSLTFGPLYDAERRLILTKSFGQINPFDNVGASGNRQLLLIDVDEVAGKKPEASASLQTSSPVETNTAVVETQSERVNETANQSSGETTKDALTEAKASGVGEEKAPVVARAVVKADKPFDLNKLRETGFWATENGPDIPQQISNMLKVGDSVIAVCRTGLYRLDLDQAKKSEATNRIAEAAKGLQGMFGIKTEAGDRNGPFKLVSPSDFLITDNVTVGATRSNDGVIAYNSGRVTLLAFEDKKFRVLAETKLEGEGTEPAIVASNDQFCLVARMDLPIEILDREMKSVASITLGKDQTIKQWYWVPGQENSLTIVTQQGKLLSLNCETQALTPVATPVSGKITCMNWKDAKQAYLGVAPNRVLLVNMEDKSVVNDYSPQLRRFEHVYNWVINPIFKVNPKPAAMDDAMAYLLTGKTTFDENLVTTKLDSSKRELSIWQPIFSNLAFVVVMLAICCIYVARKEY